MSLNGVIAAFATGTYTVTRTDVATVVDGRRVDGAQTTFDVVACVQPIDGRTLESLPEADRTSEMRLVFTEEELFARKPGFEPDSFEIDGEDWTVIRVERWQHWGDTHYRSVVSRDEVT